MSDTPRTDKAANESISAVYEESKQLERELAEARKQRDAYMQAADKSLIETHDLIESLSECVRQRDTLAEALKGMLNVTDGQAIYYFMEPQRSAAREALAAVKGGNNE